MAMPSVTVMVVNSRRRDTALRRLGRAAQRDVARRRLVPGGGDADQRLRELRLGDAHRVEHRAMRRALRPHRDVPARQLGFVEDGTALLVGH
jgi:hypothetical protein